MNEQTNLPVNWYTVKNVMKFTICLLYNVVWKLKTVFSKGKSIYFTLEINWLNAKFYYAYES